MDKTITIGATVEVSGDYSIRQARRGVITGRSEGGLYLIDFGPGFNGHNGHNVPLAAGHATANRNQWFVHPEYVTEVQVTASAVPQGKEQNDRVLKHLLSGKSITQLEAFGVYRIFRLAARIHELKSRGHKIVTTMRKDETGKQYAEYSLVSRNLRAA